MKHKVISSFVWVVIVGWGTALFVMAKDKSPEIIPPQLQVDRSSVSAGSSPVVTSYADVVEMVQPAVVSVYSTKIVTTRGAEDPISRLFGGAPRRSREHKEQGLGSGVIVTKDGYIITNNHVVEGADELSVLLPDDREYSATVIGSDPKTDIAVIKIEADDLPIVTLADSDKLRVGDVVFAVGNPLGVGQTVTMGIVSAKGRNKLGLLDNGAGYENFIQTDAAINMGNSGGALVDAKGRLVGINSAILSTTKGNIGIGFAIPVNMAATIMHSLINTGTVTRGYLGIRSETVTAEFVESLNLPKNTKGVAITEIMSDGPAEKAGLQRTDVITDINNRKVSSLEDLRLFIAQAIPGSKVNLQLIRDGKEMSIDVILEERSEHPNALLEGVDTSPLNDELRGRLGMDSKVTGLIISSVSEDSPYAGYLVPNIVIVEINRNPVIDVVNARSLFHEGRNLLLVYYRGQYRYLTVNVR